MLRLFAGFRFSPSKSSLRQGADSYDEAYVLASQLERDLRRVAAITGEIQMVKDADMMHNYQETLRRRQPAGWEPEGEGQGEPYAGPSRLVRGTATPAVIEVK